MEELKAPPSINSLEKLKNSSKEASTIYRYADRARAAENTWYAFTAEEKPGETYYAIKAVSKNGAFTWEIYKKRA